MEATFPGEALVAGDLEPGNCAIAECPSHDELTRSVLAAYVTPLQARDVTAENIKIDSTDGMAVMLMIASQSGLDKSSVTPSLRPSRFLV